MDVDAQPSEYTLVQVRHIESFLINVLINDVRWLWGWLVGVYCILQSCYSSTDAHFSKPRTSKSEFWTPNDDDEMKDQSFDHPMNKRLRVCCFSGSTSLISLQTTHRNQ
jgi:hypothetical protein